MCEVLCDVQHGGNVTDGMKTAGEVQSDDRIKTTGGVQSDDGMKTTGGSPI